MVIVALFAEPQDGDFSFLFDAPHSPTHDATADAGVDKEFSRSYWISVLTLVESIKSISEGFFAFWIIELICDLFIIFLLYLNLI